LNLGFSPDGFPFIGEVPHKKNLFISASFQGHGMVLSFLCARALVVVMTGDADALTDLDHWFPKIFWITEERMQKRFQGKLHKKPHDVELKAQS
jgi:glycine/D-amino acid oxidase-like deaminating enzyme